jgi:hypothetical protein
VVSKVKGTAFVEDGVNILSRLALRRLRLFSVAEAGIVVAGCGVISDAREIHGKAGADFRQDFGEQSFTERGIHR